MLQARGDGGPLRVGVVGGGPAGSLFALCALRYAEQARREIEVTIYEPKQFTRRGPLGCNMCAGLIPAHVLDELAELDLRFPLELFLGNIAEYALHTSAGTIRASQPDPRARVFSVYRGGGPCNGPDVGVHSFDTFLLEAAIARGAVVRKGRVETIRRGQPVEVVADQRDATHDLVVLANGVNGHGPALHGFAYQPPRTQAMCQFELYLGKEVVQRRLGGAVHIFLPPDDIAACGMLIPKGPFVTVSLMHARQGVRSMRAFLSLPYVVEALGVEERPVCACQPRIAVGPAHGLADDGLVAIGDASVTRLYKNGIGSALATARQAAWTAVFRGCQQRDFLHEYVPVCRAIDRDNWAGRVLFLQIPALKQLGLIASAHQELARMAAHNVRVATLHAQVVWGLFTGTYGYFDLLRMSVRPDLVAEFGLALMASLLSRPLSQVP